MKEPLLQVIKEKLSNYCVLNTIGITGWIKNIRVARDVTLLKR